MIKIRNYMKSLSGEDPKVIEYLRENYGKNKSK